MDTFDSNAAGYLLDLDGTLISGRTVLPDARWLLDQVRDRFILVSNNAEHVPEQLSVMLRRLGLAVAPERIVLAGTTAIDLVARDHPRTGIMLLGSTALRAAARRRGLRIDAAAPDFVMVMRDRRFSYAKLVNAAEALRQGASLVVACSDTSHPGEAGRRVPETGALAAAILAVAGDVEHRVVGKPEPLLFQAACDRLGIEPTRALMIGDNPMTDGLGARRLGMAFLQVRDGRLRRELPGEPVAGGLTFA